MPADGDGDDRFADRLERFVLVSFAHGARVEGEWFLIDVDEFVPNLYVAISRVGDTVDRRRQPDWFDFKERLQEFLLSAYADGADVVGEREVRFAAPELPAWRVQIRTLDPVEQRSREPPNGNTDR